MGTQMYEGFCVGTNVVALGWNRDAIKQCIVIMIHVIYIYIESDNARCYSVPRCALTRNFPQISLSSIGLWICYSRPQRCPSWTPLRWSPWSSCCCLTPRVQLASPLRGCVGCREPPICKHEWMIEMSSSIADLQLIYQDGFIVNVSFTL